MSRLDAEAQRVLGALSVADIERYLRWRRAERRQGFVRTFSQGLVKLEVGQRWGYLVKPEFTFPIDPDAVLPLTLISVDPSGEVVLRPADAAMAERVFPLQDATFKGKPVQTRQCPFLWVEERMAKGSQGKYQTGDLACNEAWTMWERMHLHTEGLLVPDL